MCFVLIKYYVQKKEKKRERAHFSWTNKNLFTLLNTPDFLNLIRLIFIIREKIKTVK